MACSAESLVRGYLSKIVKLLWWEFNWFYSTTPTGLYHISTSSLRVGATIISLFRFFIMSNHISICSWCSSRHKQEGGWRELVWNHPWRSLVSSTKIELLSMILRLHNIPFGDWFGIYSKHLLHFCLYYWARFSLSWICAQSRNRAYKTKHKESSAAHSRHSSGNTYSCYDFILDSGDLCFRKMNSYFLTEEKLGSNIL